MHPEGWKCYKEREVRGHSGGTERHDQSPRRRKAEDTRDRTYQPQQMVHRVGEGVESKKIKLKIRW